MNRILIIRSGGIGDTLLLLPFLRYLESQYPGVSLTLVGRPDRMGLLASQVSSVQVMDPDDDFYHLYSSEVDTTSDLWSDLRNKDWIINFTCSPESNLVHNLNRCGCPRVDHLSALPPDHISRHAIFHPFDALGIDIEVMDLLTAAMSRFRSVQRFEEKPESNIQSPTLTLCPGAGSRQKCWPLERWCRVIKTAIQETDSRILLIRGPAEEGLDFAPLVEVGDDKLRILESPDLSQLAVVLAGCSAFIGNDSGLTHLAAMTGIPTLALFGPTDPRIWGPVGAQSRVFWVEQDLKFPDWISSRVDAPAQWSLSPIEAHKVGLWVKEIMT